MTDYGTIKLPRDAYERHNERRKELGLTWEEYVEGEAPDAENAVGDVDLTPVMNRIDDLENELPKKVARELR